MHLRNDKTGYGVLAMSAHWLMLLLLVAVFATMELNDIFPKGSAERAAMKTWHFMLGLSVLALVLLRLLFRLTDSAPVVTPAPARWQERAGKSMHLLLYVFMILMPLLGWLILSAKGKPIPFFGLSLPALIGKNKETAHWIKDIHETGATVGYVLIGLHAAAALLHHYVIRDDTLRRMLPRR
ncbi:cytochrome b [Actimicrobium sp. CCI2.3]|uniref:cytochrome b n=1 Tax=Actimicrobium sp. CCI2.3 TaxID=3048616 RepID=UPI002AB40767|nr:cytochrome b [Actimicrobium sp. CCI2.3]MDY7574767.1 cytochrome b [Actimicrobium sp. CCI2.3]MEB0020272.1 cytochrome b [Actimicrobium sp. CCI2.3]